MFQLLPEKFAQFSSLLPTSTGSRPSLSRAAMMPSGVRIRMVVEPLITSWAWRMPSTRVSHWLMSAATSSVSLILPLDWAMN